jgi:hypothetical protein
MQSLLFTPNSVRYLPVLIITLLITVYLSRLKSRGAFNRWLAWWFGLITLLNFAYFCSVSIYDLFWSAVFSDFGGQLIAFLTCIPLILFAYNFPQNYHKRESIYVPALLCFLFLVFSVLYIPETLLNGQPFYNFQNYGFTLRRITDWGLVLDNIVLILTTFGYLWSVTILLRKTVSITRFCHRTLLQPIQGKGNKSDWNRH